MARLALLGDISAEDGRLTRVFMSPEQLRASALVLQWMGAAGLAARVDAAGNVVGRLEGARPGLPALVLGSHLDTVRNAGRYDGPLGVVTAIACVAGLPRASLPFAIEVVGFSDEEGTRFGAALLGSKAFAGRFDAAALALRDADGVTMAEAFMAAGFDPAAIVTAARRPEEIAAYVELHIEQGPVLERRGLPVGCVSSISGAARYVVDVSGVAGHAGTVPMAGRVDALAAAAEMVLAVEACCAAAGDIVGTVGRLEVAGGAINVIAGQVRYTIDIRAPEDGRRRAVESQLFGRIHEIAARRSVRIAVEKIYDVAATPCAPWLMAQLEAAIAACGVEPVRLPSGAGHDGMAISAIADIGMIFVRCAGGISHHPAEAITAEDAGFGARVLRAFIENFRKQEVLF